MNLNRLHLTLMIRIHPSPTQLIPSRLTQNPNLIRNHLIPTQLILSLSTQIRLNPTPNRRTQSPMNLTLMNQIRTHWTRLPHSQFPQYKPTDKRMKGLRCPKGIVNESTSSSPLLNRPALTPIVRGEKLACV